jgi:hypothetical protein
MMSKCVVGCARVWLAGMPGPRMYIGRRISVSSIDEREQETCEKEEAGWKSSIRAMCHGRKGAGDHGGYDCVFTHMAHCTLHTHTAHCTLTLHTAHSHCTLHTHTAHSHGSVLPNSIWCSPRWYPLSAVKNLWMGSNGCIMWMGSRCKA